MVHRAIELHRMVSVREESPSPGPFPKYGEGERWKPMPVT